MPLDARGVPLGLVRAHTLLVVGSDDFADSLAFIDVGPRHLVEIYDAGPQDDCANRISRSLVLALIEYLESVLDDDAFVAIKLIPEPLLDLIGPRPIQHVNILVLLSNELSIGYFEHLVQCRTLDGS